MAADHTILARWTKRAAVAVLIGAIASFLYHAISFIRMGLSNKLLGDAYHFAFRLAFNDALRGGRVIGTPRLMYVLVLVTNTLLYAVVILMLFGWKDLLTTARAASRSERVRRVVTFCLVQAHGTCFVLFEIDPGTVVGTFLLLPGIVVAVWLRGGALYLMLVTLCVNAVVWLGYFSISDLNAHSAN
jgi:hypothetical protein